VTHGRESSQERHDRLVREGRWEPFEKLRDQLKLTMSAKDADAQAEREFPPQDSVGNTAVSTPVESKPAVPTAVPLETFKNQKPVDARKVVEWVFENIEVQDAKPESAPSPGAWGLLQWVRSSPDSKHEFYSDIWPKPLAYKVAA